MDAWPRLETTEKFRIALDVARRRSAEFVRSIGNVVAVGAGFRLRGPDELLVPEVCLCFHVARKWKGRRRRAGAVPGEVIAYPVIDGRRQRVVIPTDVNPMKDGAPQGHLDLTEGISARRANSHDLLGSACCMVRNTRALGERFLLSCYHVFSPRLSASLESVDCHGPSARIGPLHAAASVVGDAGIDAALVLVSDSQVSGISTWGQFPVARANDNDMAQLVNGQTLFLMVRRVAPPTSTLGEMARSDCLAVQFRSITPGRKPFNYRRSAGRMFYFTETIEYLADVRPGDSGSALVGANGTLYGMHFYGQGRRGFAFPAPRLFHPGIFGFDIELG